MLKEIPMTTWTCLPTPTNLAHLADAASSLAKATHYLRFDLAPVEAFSDAHNNARTLVACRTISRHAFEAGRSARFAGVDVGELQDHHPIEDALIADVRRGWDDTDALIGGAS